jgi:outer membrane protein assembly factor BamB
MLVYAWRLVIRIFTIVLLLQATGHSGDWTRFRGPNGTGVSSDTGLPDQIDRKRNLVWRVAIPPGGSSPVVSGRRVFVTSHEENALVVLCLDASMGKLLWRRQVGKAHPLRQTKPNDSATPTPVADESAVYVFFPEFGVISYTHDGAERWRVPLGPFNPPHGMATSPILAGSKLVIAADQVTGSSVTAIRISDGAIAWKADRPSFVGGYSTPVTYQPPRGPIQVVVSSPLELAAYSAANGEKVWSAPRMGVMPISVPVFGDGVFFVNNGAVPPFAELAVTFRADRDRDGRLTPEEFPDPAFQEAVRALDRERGNGDGAIDAGEWNGWLRLLEGLNALVAVRPPGAGGVAREVWRVTRGLPDVPSPVFYRDALYMVKDGGILTALDPGTGEIRNRIRLSGAIDKYFASPVAADGKLYLIGESGKTATVRAGRDPERIAAGDLGEECYATPAIANGSVYVRTGSALYRFAAHAN